MAVAACFLAAATGCNDPVQPRAQREVASGSVVASALTGSGPNTPSALLLSARGAALPPLAAAPEVIAGSDFDLAVDINAAGDAVLYPAQLVAQLAPRRVGLRRITESYDTYARAVTGGYRTDSALVARTGETIAVQVPAVGNECLYSGRPYYYSKLVVDSVRVASRLVFLRATTNPNCGFRSFAAGLPPN
jgi:hypothetical protein